MDYLLITEQQAQKKYNSLPDKIRNILDSENNVVAVGQICRQHHLDDERILIVNQLVALILLGFVSPNDFRQEIINNLHLNYQHSDDIAKEIYEKIFAPIRIEIDKIYSPIAPDTGLKPAEEKVEEHIVDLKTFEKPKEEIKKIEKPVEIIETKKLIEAEKLEVPRPPVFTPSKLMSEVVEEGPVIIHKEIETNPTLGKQRSLGGLFGFLRAQKLSEMKVEKQKPVTAEVEIPILELPKPPKMVHYSDFKTPLSVSMLPKPEIKSKIFESEIEKAKKSGMIIDNLQFKIEEIPIEIEEVPRKSFISKIFQFFANLFVTKKKVIKEISIPLPPMSPKSEKTKEFEFPLEIKLPETQIAVPLQGTPPKKESELPKPAMSELKTDIFITKEIEPPEVHEAREKTQPTPQPEKPKTQDDEVIDLRTFQMIKK